MSTEIDDDVEMRDCLIELLCMIFCAPDAGTILCTPHIHGV